MNTSKNKGTPLTIKTMLQELSNTTKARNLTKFFQAYPGGYGEGDRFIGVSVPDQRSVAQKHYAVLSAAEVESLLQESIHEYRLTALFVLVLQYQKAKRDEDKEAIIRIYCRNFDRINNWDLVDSSAHLLLGPHLFTRERSLLYTLADSGDVWQQRIAIMTTFHFIKKHQFDDTLKLAQLFFTHNHHLIHKAAGWMLREIGKKNYELELAFIKAHVNQMPRTMLRYAIEKFETSLRKNILQGTI